MRRGCGMEKIQKERNQVLLCSFFSLSLSSNYSSNVRMDYFFNVIFGYVYKHTFRGAMKVIWIF